MNKRSPFGPQAFTLLVLAILAIAITSWFVDGMRPALTAGMPWLVAISAVYLIWGRKRSRT